MPKLRSKPLTAGRAPDELRNPDHAVWRSARATVEWMDRAGMDRRGRTFADDAPLTRHHVVARLWALEAGLTRDLANGSAWPDWSAMRAAGIPADSGARILERMTTAGVTVGQ